MIPEIRYAKAGDIQIAYQVFGSGALDLVVVPGWLSNLEIFWEDPAFARFLRGLGSFARVIIFDKRGTGLSDRVTDSPTLEERMEDVHAVMDAVGCKRAALFGYSEGGPMCALHAVTYPARTSALIMHGSYPRRTRTDDFPWGVTAEEVDRFVDSFERDWGGPIGIELRMPSVAHDPAVRQFWGRALRMSASAKTARILTKCNSEIDIRHLLPAIRVPALIMHATGDRTTPVACSRYLAQHIPGAKLVELPTDDHVPWIGCPDRVLDEMAQFLTGAHHAAEVDCVVATILMTDIVDSTRLAGELGDAKWAQLRAAHNEAVRRELAGARGKEIDNAGDGFCASFDGPARAIRCARAIRDAVERLGARLRIGLHTGECVLEPGRVSGIALHLAARVAATAGAGEIVVSRTVKDLVAGAGIQFADLGAHQLKGFDDPWQLYRVVAG